MSEHYDRIESKIDKARASEDVLNLKARNDALESQVSHRRELIKKLTVAAAKSNDVICQTLGKVLGFPWYEDDLKTFPDATQDDGVCVGDHTAETLATNAADRIQFLEGRLNWHSIAKDDYPPDNECTEVIVAVTNDEYQWVTYDRYDGYSKTFENNYCPQDSYRIYKWRLLPAIPALED
jgi:hypothetical protein